MDEQDLYGIESKNESAMTRDGTFTRKSRLSKSEESEGGRGILNNAYGPREGSSFPVTMKQASWFQGGSDNERMDDSSRPRTMMSVRPVTAMSQAGDFIPSLEDLNLVHEASDAPQVAVNQIASYQDLERDRGKHSTSTFLEGNDLSLLLKRLLPEHELIEKDEPWTWDGLISDVSSRPQSQLDDDQELNVLRINSEFDPEKRF